MTFRLPTNAVLNVLAGASGALFAFLVPALLAGRIAAIELSVWAVVLQTAAYAAPFALGIQSVLARHVALHVERCDSAGLHQTMAAAFRVLGLAAGAYLGLACLVALGLEQLYPAIPPERLREARLAFLVFAFGQASLIPAAAMAGYFFGLQRNLAITANLLGSRILATLGIVGLSGMAGLVVLAAVASAITLGGNLWLYAAYRRSLRRRFGPTTSGLQTAARRSLLMLKECGPISLWTLAHFLIYGGTGTIASTTDFANFPAYSMAAAATLVLLGLHGAAMNALIPHVAVVQERGGPGAVARTLERASLVSAAISALVLAGYAFGGPVLVSALIPAGPAQVTAALLPILLYGNVIRLLGLPYSNTLVGLGLQGRILWTPVLEAATTFGAAWWLAPRYGLPGVAASIAVGGVLSILLHFLVNMPLTRDAVPTRRWRTLLQSLLVLTPAIAALVLWPIQTRA